MPRIKELEVRMKAFRAFLTENPDRDIPWDELKREISNRLGKEFTVTDSKLDICIRKFRDELPDRRALKVLGTLGGVDGEESRTVRYNQRVPLVILKETNQLNEKHGIGAAIWHFLLGLCSTEQSEGACYVTPETDWPPRVRDRVYKLRRNQYASIILDSGSTVRAASEEFLKSRHMPLRTNPIEAPRDARRICLPDEVTAKLASDELTVHPTMLTNNPLILTDVVNSSHWDRFELRMVGGHMTGNTASTTGALAESCLAAWGYSGKSVSMDVAILGCRGIKEDHTGQKSLWVAALAQAAIKARFLSMVNLRCVAMASKKISTPEGSHVFAGLSGNDIDIIFTDMTEEKESLELYLDSLEAEAKFLPVMYLDHLPARTEGERHDKRLNELEAELKRLNQELMKMARERGMTISVPPLKMWCSRKGGLPQNG